MIALGTARTRRIMLAQALILAIPAARTIGGEGLAAEGRLRADVGYLADDAREGRGPGTEGIERAADYIAGAFREAGLKPAPGLDGYFQPFTIRGNPRIGEPKALAFEGPDDATLKAGPGSDFAPLAIGVGGTIEGAPVAFAGYGITAKEESLKLDYDDYAGLDAQGKAVLILRKEPQQGDDASPFAGKRTTSYATFQHKITNAFQHGAAVVLLVNDAETVEAEKGDDLLGFGAAGPNRISDLPVVMLTRAFADRLLAEAGQPRLADLEREIDADLKPHSRAFEGWSADASIAISREPIATKNVIGVLEGSGPHADETIVIGAHYDHLGRGGEGSLDRGSEAIHNGADDNASGTALLMEMARRLARRPDPLARRVVFAAFSGEERGLLGSAHYVKGPPIPLDRTVMMVNFDMVGRLNDDDELTVYGTGTSPGFDALIETLGRDHGFTIKPIASGFGPSDQQSFYTKDIPVLFAFTGTHKDYHRPTDDVEAINFGGMARIADLMELILLDLARRPDRPSFTRVPGGSHGGDDPGRIALKVYLGTIPDYDDAGQGVKLTGVRDDSPAARGGLKGGDIIIKLGDKPIGTINDYMESLGRFQPGETAKVVVRRAGAETTLTVTFGSRSSD